METITQKTTMDIAVADILSVSNRKHGGMGDIGLLAESIRVLGLIEPLAVMRQKGEPAYRIVAGRRRLEAVKMLGWDRVPAVILSDDTTEETEEEIALAENINRLDTHPLDEAATFKRLFDAGKSIEEIALYYSRSVSGIYHRIRLNNLIDEIKGMFRCGRLSITGASVLAGLTPEQQKAFCETVTGTVTGGDEVEAYEIKNFIKGVQNERYVRVADSGRCAECKKRTRYKDAALFEEYASYDDVCFDPDCFRERLKERIADAVRRAREEYGDDKKHGDGKEHRDSAEIRRIVLNADTARFFDEYTGRMEIGGVSYSIQDSGGDLEPANSDEYEGYNFGAWYVPALYGSAIVYPRYYIDGEGRERMRADLEAKRARKAEAGGGRDDEPDEDEDEADETGDEPEDDEDEDEAGGEGREEAGHEAFLDSFYYDDAGIPAEEQSAVDNALGRKYKCTTILEGAVKERVHEKIIRQNAGGGGPERQRRVIRQWLEREFDDMPGYAPSSWKKTFELYTGIRFDDDDVFSKLADMPAGKLAELIEDLRFNLYDLPALEIMNDEDDMPEDDYEQSPIGAFAGGSLDRLRDIYRETFKDLAREAVEEAGTA